MTENYWKLIPEEEEWLTKELKRLWEGTEKRILADSKSVAEIKRVANKCNEKEEVVLIFTVLLYFEKAGIVSKQYIKDVMGC